MSYFFFVKLVSEKSDHPIETNVLAVKFNLLSQPGHLHTGDAIVCCNEKCTVVLNHYSKLSEEVGKKEKVCVKKLSLFVTIASFEKLLSRYFNPKIFFSETEQKLQEVGIMKMEKGIQQSMMEGRLGQGLGRRRKGIYLKVCELGGIELGMRGFQMRLM